MYRRIDIIETASREGKRSVNLLTESRSHYPFISFSGCHEKTFYIAKINKRNQASRLMVVDTLRISLFDKY